MHEHMPIQLTPPTTLPRKHPWTPERRLLSVMLEDAWNCALGELGSIQEQEEAREWFDSPDEWWGSFLGVCGVLRLDPTAVKRALRKAKADLKAGTYHRRRIFGQAGERSHCAAA